VQNVLWRIKRPIHECSKPQPLLYSNIWFIDVHSYDNNPGEIFQLIGDWVESGPDLPEFFP